MNQPTLYLLVGYPGSGKTTTSHALHELTGATHIWTDYERQKMFGKPTHAKAESDELYDFLNARTAELLRSGTSVIFDTNFSFRADRDYLRDIAAECGALVHILWIQVPPDVARERATHNDHADRNGYESSMEPDVFERIVSHLEPPTEDEQPIILDGTQISPPYIAQKLGI